MGLLALRLEALQLLQTMKMLMQPHLVDLKPLPSNRRRSLSLKPSLVDLKPLPSNRPLSLSLKPSLRPSRPQGQVARHLLVMMQLQTRWSW